jgi:hypothetical protein
MNRWRLISVVFLLVISNGAVALAQTNPDKPARKVTVTLVRWPYT